MNEQALQDAFNLFTEEGYNGTFDDYKELIKTNEDAFNDSYGLFKSTGYNGSQNDFSSLMGLETAKTQDSAAADPIVESQNDTGSKSESGLSRSVDASDFENTKEKNTYIEDFFGKNEFTDFVGDIYRAGKSGWTAGASVNEAFDIYKGKEATDQEVKDFLEKTRDIEANGQTDEMIAASQKMAELKEKGYNGFSAFLGGWWDNPSAMLQYTAMSMAQMVRAAADSEEVIGTAAAAAGGSAAAGAAVGSIVPGIGTAVGAGVSAGAGFFGGLSGAMETGMTTAALIQEKAVEDGLDWSKMSDDKRFDYIRKLQNDEDGFNDIKSKALARGVSIGAIDGITGILTAGAGSAVFKGVSKSARSGIANAARVAASAAVETAGGMASEIAGQAAAGQEFNLEEVLIEGFADKTFTSIEIAKAINTGSPKYVVNKKQVNGKKFIDAIKIMSDEAIVKADIQIENSPAVQKLIDNRRQNIAADQKVDSRISDVDDRAEAIKIQKEINALGTAEGNKIKKKQLQAKIAEIETKYENSEVDVDIQSRQEAVANALETEFEKRFNVNYNAANEFGKKVGIKSKVYKTELGYKKAIEKAFGSLPKGWDTSTGVFAGEGVTFINKAKIRNQVDIATGSFGDISTASHEVLHPIFNALIGSSKEQTKVVNKFRRNMTSKQKAYVDQQIKARNISKENIGIETMNIFSDGIVKGEINYDKTTFEKIGGAISGFIRGAVGLNKDDLNFKDGESVYNFLKEYNEGIKAGEVSDATISKLKEAEAQSTTKIKDVKILGQEQFSKSLSEDVSNTVKEQVLKIQDVAKEGREIAAKFGKEFMKSGKQERLEQKVLVAVQPVIEKIVTNRTKALYDPIAPDQKRNVSREDYQDSMRSDLQAMLVNEYNGTQDVEKFLVNRGYLRANDLAKRLGIETTIKASLDAVDSEGKGTIQIASDYDPETTMTEIRSEENRKKKLVDPRIILGPQRSKDYTEAVGEAIADMVSEDFSALSFAKLKDMAPDITADWWRTTVKKVTTSAANLATKEIPYMQRLIIKHADMFISMLPEGAILEGETAREELIGTGVGVPRKLQQAFYDKGERTSKGAGLIPFNLKRNITKEDFYAAFGINKDETLVKITGKDPRAQTILALIRLYGQITTNTAIRELAELTSEQKADIRAGAAQIQFSLEANKEVFIKNGLGSKDIQSLFDIMINFGGVFSSKAKKYLEDLKITDTATQDTILSEVTHEGIIAMMQDIKSSNNGFKYEKALRESLSKLGKGFKVDYIAGKKGDLTIKGPKGIEFKVEVKLNNKAQVGSLNASLFEVKNNQIKLKNFTKETLKLSKKISESNTIALLESINNNKKYLESVVEIINDLNKKLTGPKIGLNRSGHIKFPKTTTLNNKLIEGKTLWDEIKNKNNGNAGYFSYDSDHTIVEDLYKGVDLIEIGAHGAYAIGKDSKASKFYNSLKAEITNVVRPVISSETVYFRLFPNFKEIINEKSNSLSTKEGIEKLTKIISESEGPQQFSKVPLSDDFNNIIEESTGIKAKKIISEAKGKMLARGKGRFKFFIPPSADDFAGLLYKLLGKGDKGNQQQAWFKENLFDPFSRGIRDFESYKENAALIVKNLKKSIKNIPAGLKKINETGFTNEDAVRVYLWAKQGIDIPGLTKEDQTELINVVNKSPKLVEFAKKLDLALGKYPEPQNDWLAGTITTDAINMINTTKRAEFLQEWQENVDEIFSKDNLNKLRAAFGDNYVEAMEDMLYRMKSGRNRPSGSNKLTNKFMNWVNDSVGTIMFFNTRSALLQTLSTVNFINWGDNNPIEAGKAFANQKQFWSDFAMLFNSDFLKQRRSGLKNDINADDIASAAETATNKAGAVKASLLKMGFLPTQMADSFAIALGGASFVRNRFKSLKKADPSLTDDAAMEQALLDFQEIAEESQQSSRPDRISQQQASPLGRVVLAFANTPMQYMRLTKKAFLDLKNGRGDAKTNITKIAYYMAVQNIIFTALQSALFASLFEDDEEELNNKEIQMANSMLDSILRGVGVYGAIASTLKNIAIEVKKQSDKDRPDFTVAAQRALSISPPVDSKMRKLMSAGRAFSYKTTREKMKGFGLDNPAYYATGQIVSAATNIPLDRAIRKADNIRVALDNDTKYWQSIALMLGYSQWDVGMVETSKDKKKKKSKFGSSTKWKSRKWGKKD